MTESPLQSNPLILGTFLEHLRALGFAIGVDDYLRVQQLLNQPGFLCAPAELKLVLCPLFATNEKRQKQFYEIFDDFFGSTLALTELPTTTDAAASSVVTEAVAKTRGIKAPRRKWPYLVAAGVALLPFFVIAVWLLLPHSDLEIPLLPIPPVTMPPSTTASGEIRIIPNHPIGQANDSTWERVLSREPIPLPPIRQETQVDGWARRNWWWLAPAINAAPLLLAALWWLWRKRNQHRLQAEQRDKHPPFTWTLSVSKTTQRLHEVGSFNATTRLLRRRQQSEGLRLDVEATIAATVARSGFPTLQFRPLSKVPEYLILIDRATLADHQARFFDDFVARLNKEDIFIERYFYDGDPRLCYHSDYRTGVWLEDLPRRGHRLLIYGDGTRLLEANSGELAEWAEWFADWEDRVLLTPVAPVQWGSRERKLSELFLVLPATLEGLREAITHFELRNHPDLRAWRNRSTENALPVFAYDATPEKTAEKLQAYLKDENLFQWVCACAVYPEIQWNLTLCLGELVMPEGQLWEKDILRLARLPWFQQGSMPDELRHTLLRHLTTENRKQVSQKLSDLLQHTEEELLKKYPHFSDSWARESLQLQVNMQQWLAAHTDKNARALRQKLRALPPSLTVGEYATLREAEAEPLTPSMKSFTGRLSAQWRDRLFPYGIPLLGLKPGVVFSFIAPLALLLGLGSIPLKPAAETNVILLPQAPKEERLIVILKTSPTPSTLGNKLIPQPEYGGLRLILDRTDWLRNTTTQAQPQLSIELRDQRTGKVSSHLSPLASPVIDNLLVGKYSVTVGGTTLPNGNNLKITCEEAEVLQGKTTPVNCRTEELTSTAVSCFAQTANISLNEQMVRAGSIVPLSGSVQGGQNYGELTFDWSASAGKIVTSGASQQRAGYALDTTGIVPNTPITINLRVTSSRGNCYATAQALLSTASPMSQALMPNLIGQDTSSARRVLEALELKLQVTTQTVPDTAGTLGMVVRQVPAAGQPLQTGQQVTLYIAQAPTPTPRSCYRVSIDRIQVFDTGSGDDEPWEFVITAGGERILTLPATTYYEKRDSVPSAKMLSGSASWCGTGTQGMRITIDGTRPNKSDPKERTASGSANASAATNPFPLLVPVTAYRATDGDFRFYLTITPFSPAAGR